MQVATELGQYETLANTYKYVCFFVVLFLSCHKQLPSGKDRLAELSLVLCEFLLLYLWPDCLFPALHRGS